MNPVTKINPPTTEQLQKQVQQLQAELEQKNRELMIEAALERIRSRTMAMQRSDELTDTVHVLYEQFKELGEVPDQMFIGIFNEEEGVLEVSGTDPNSTGSKFQNIIKIPFTEPITIKPIYEAWKAGKKSITFDLQGQALIDYIKLRSSLRGVPVLPEQMEGRRIINIALFSKGDFGISTLEPRPASTIALLERFAGVFDLTYTRFLDLKKAEAQAREAKIEVSLERIRTRTMAMQSSDELTDTAAVLFHELKTLGIEAIRTGVGIIDAANETIVVWSQQFNEKNKGNILGVVPANTHPFYEAYFKAWKNKEPYFIYTITGEDVREYYESIASHLSYQQPDSYSKQEVFHVFFFPEGSLSVLRHELLTDEQCNLMVRFANVFGILYRRFMDLKQAEAQTREAKIEAALERVRSRTMAMQRSDELAETAYVLFQQFRELGEEPDQMNISIINEEEGVLEVSGTDPDSTGSKFQHIVKIPLTEPTLGKSVYEAWKAGKKATTFDLHGQALIDYIKFRSSLRGIPARLEQMEGHRIINAAFFSKGNISISTFEPRPASTIALLERFASVFDLTYTRFLDLKKAEAQAREAKIEAALERVRARTMAMQHSSELSETAFVLYRQFAELGEAPETIWIAIVNEENETLDFWATKQGGNKLDLAFKATIHEPIVMNKIYTAWKEQKKSIVIDLHGRELADYYQFLKTTGYPDLEEKLNRTYENIACFSKGVVGLITLEPKSPEGIQLLERFAGVFDLTYTRFLDLKKAEAQAKEAQLERERSEALLLNILPADIANELKQFGKSYARSHDEVTILFADIKNFSAIAENMSPQELVTQLDECFRAFDHIVEKHGLEKIKTIGDAYMCVCGLPGPVPDNAFKTVKAALAMLEFIKGFGISKQAQGLPAFEFRVGIHTGPVVTGVVGLKKFTYDIWGDAVNMAARMEQHGEAGKINISGTTYQLVKDRFELTYRGKIPAKNKGEVDMYFVERVM